MFVIDPGLNRSGMAEFRDGRLVDAFVVENHEVLDKASIMAAKIIALGVCGFTVVELPRVYRGSPVDPEDLIQLACLAGMLRANRYVRPAEWKKQIPKTRDIDNYIVKKRVVSLLTEDERKMIKDGKFSDVYDAIGIGLFVLGRALPGMERP